MLPQKNRLTKKEDFAKVYRQGLFFSEGEVSLKLVKNNLSESRFGFPIEKKYFKLATERNRTKRILRETVRLNLNKIRKGFDVAVFCRKKGKIESDEIRNKMEKLFRKSNLT